LISRFFIDRPIFASVLSIVITLAGGLAITALPVAQYPPISPPNISVDCNYPGASAKVVAETVAAPIEQQVNGVENMMYMSSQCTNDGSYNLTVTFKHGVDLNMALVMVQNRVSLATPLLPDPIKATGVTTRKRSPDILMSVALNSPDGRYDQLYLSNYALMHVKEEIARLPGVGDIFMLGQRDFSMRIWVDPEKLTARSMTAGDVVNALREQNAQVATGQIGQQPAPKGQPIQVTLSTLGRLLHPEQFGEVILKVGAEGRVTRLKDVAKIELGAKNQDISTKVNGKPCVSLAIFQLPDANALDVADTVMKKMEELKSEFPVGVDYEVRYNTTPYIRESIREVFKTLRDAIILVAIVVLLFLQNWRSAVIPLIAVPVAIIGTFAAMLALGFSLNNLTLFGLVLAIGIVVDDAIVVVEAVEHHIEHGMAPRDATIRAMDEVSGPVIAIGLVLTAVFVPCAFISGIIGQFFRQFALTIAVSTIISAFNSLTLSPALAALLLRPKDEESHEVLPRLAIALFGGWLGFEMIGPWLEPHLGRILASSPSYLLRGPDQVGWAAAIAGAAAGAAGAWLVGGLINRLLSGFFGWFNAGFRRATNLYTRAIGGLLRVSLLVLLIYGGMLSLTYLGFVSTPTGFIPSQDMGYLLVNVQLPDAASAERTHEVMDRLEVLAKQTPGVKHTQTISGQSFLLSAFGSNFGSMFIMLDTWANRPDPMADRIWRWMDRRTIPGRAYVERRVRRNLEVLDEENRDVVVKKLEGWGWLTPPPPPSMDGTKPKPPEDPKLSELAGRKIDDIAAFVRRRFGAGYAEGFQKWFARPQAVVWTDPKRLAAQGVTDDAVAAALHEEGLLFSVGEPSEEGERRPITLITLGRGPTPDHQKPARLKQLGEVPVKAADGRSVPLQAVGLLQDGTSLYGDAVANVLRAKFGGAVPEAVVAVFGPPPVRGVGRAGGWKIMIEDRGDNGPEILQDVTEKLIDRGNHTRALVGLATVFRANVPTLWVEVDRKKCLTKGVALKDFFDTLQVYLGSLYVNDFNLFGRTWQVIVQADSKFRKELEDVRRLKVRNNHGLMVPLGTLSDVKEVNGPLVLTRYNMYPSSFINGNAAPGTSSGEAIALMEKLSTAELPPSMTYEWTELAYLEKEAGNTAMIIFGFAVVMVFLVLAAQYESWSLPLAVILVVPMCLLCAISGVNVADEDVNIFTQVGFVVLVGLASKNAILIVEFAKAHRQAGASRRQATLEACRLRLRPIIMTSMAFVLGVIPLILSAGAGAEMRRTLGTAVFSGMLGVTLFGIFLTPVFFFLVDLLGETRLFRSRLMRRLGDVSLDVFALGYVRHFAQRRLLGRNGSSPDHTPTPSPSPDGHGAPAPSSDGDDAPTTTPGELVEQK
jgi:multidrug efflux pump subunit AcrB